jgi:hypothetical protein
MRLGLCLFSGVFSRFDFTEAIALFDNVSGSNRFAAVFSRSLSPSDGGLVHAAGLRWTGTIFSVLQSSFDEAIALIRVLNADLCNFAFDDWLRFEAWHELAGSSLLYLVDLSQVQSHALRSVPSDLFCCSSISSMIEIIYRMYMINSSLYKKMNQFLAHFPISLVSKYMRELQGFLHYIYLLQSSIEYHSHTNPIRENLIVHRGIQRTAAFAQLYESMIGDIVVWPGFTSTSADRDYLLRYFVTGEDCILAQKEQF